LEISDLKFERVRRGAQTREIPREIIRGANTASRETNRDANIAPHRGEAGMRNEGGRVLFSRFLAV